RRDNLTDWAAALTYYSVLSTFPMLIAFVGVVGLVGQHPQTTNAILRIINDLGPSSAVDTFRGPVQGVISNKSGAGVALVVGLAGALWSGSGYIGAFTRASNTIYEVEEGRPFWKLRPLQLSVTIVIWIVASAGFAFYVASFSSYNKTYGSLAGVIVFLVWLWISNLAVLLGAEFNAELERGRELELDTAGAQERIQVEPRVPTEKA